MSPVIPYLTAPFAIEHKEKVLHNKAFFSEARESHWNLSFVLFPRGVHAR